MAEGSAAAGWVATVVTVAVVRAVVMEGVRVVAVRAGVARAEVVRVVARAETQERVQEPRAAALMERSEPPRKHMQPRATHGAVPSGF